MAEIRLNKIIRQYNIGLDDLVNFLRNQGVEVDLNPNAKISDEYLGIISRQFGKDLELKQAADKVDIKISEIIEKGRKQPRQEEDEDFEPEHETIIKSNTFINVKKETPAPVKEEEIVPEPKKEELVEPEAPVQEPEVEEAGTVEPQKPQETETPVQPEPEEVQQAVSQEPADEPEEESATPDQEPGEPEGESVEKAEPEVIKEEPAARSEAPKESDGKKEEKNPEGGIQLKVVGKIDLSQFDRKPSKKRERINKGTQKVDVSKAGEHADKNQKKDKKGGGNQQQGQQKDSSSSKSRRRDRDKFKPALTEAEQESLQKEIQKQVKETYAKMNEGKKNNFGAKYRKEKREASAQRTQEEMLEAAAEKKVLKVTEFVTVNDLATLMNNTPVVKVIGACMSLGLMVSINQRLDAETLVLVAEEFGYTVEFVTADISEKISSNEQVDRPEDLQPRPPIITVMGHVDHGKTSLLDYIRKSNVIAGEAGGITQHIGAYNVEMPDGRHITFLDTPGHEAFTAMRARGAQLTDLAIIIVAADDAVMPQTIEAINHAQAANVPMVFAINKIDKPGADPEKIRRQLSEMNILVEDWGGKYQCQEISAKKGLNVDKLLEKVLLETDILELKANPDKLALGAVI